MAAASALARLAARSPNRYVPHVETGEYAELQQRLRALWPSVTLRSIGDNPGSAHALGIPVIRYRYLAVLFGGACAGLAGAHLSLVYTPQWVENMTAGRGWIALALTTFATWRPARVLLGAYLFGGVTMLQFHLQGEGVQVPSQFLTMLPYLATIVVLVLISRNASFIRVNMPASIGKPFFPG